MCRNLQFKRSGGSHHRGWVKARFGLGKTNSTHCDDASRGIAQQVQAPAAGQNSVLLCVKRKPKKHSLQFSFAVSDMIATYGEKSVLAEHSANPLATKVLDVLDEGWPRARHIKLPTLPGQLERDLRLSWSSNPGEDRGHFYIHRRRTAPATKTELYLDSAGN